MQDLAEFLGRLLGSAINPFVWVPVLLIVWFYRRKPLVLRFALALGAVLCIAIVAYSVDPGLTFAEKTTGTIFGLLSAALWTAIAASLARLLAR